jgi:hypothetical protein
MILGSSIYMQALLVTWKMRAIGDALSPIVITNCTLPKTSMELCLKRWRDCRSITFELIACKTMHMRPYHNYLCQYNHQKDMEVPAA